MQNIQQRTTKLIRGAALIALVCAPAASAQQRPLQERPLYVWRGVVDDDVRISMRAGGIQSQVVSGSVGTRARVNRRSNLPRQEGTVRIEMLEGRGTVRVIQQPSALNRYTAIVQVKDAQGGAAPYRFAAYFDPSQYSGGEVDLPRAGTPVFRWRGHVDGDIQITLRRGGAGYRVLSGDNPRNVTSNILSGGMPARDARLALMPRSARGRIAVVQQPSASNDYIAVIRISDPEPGFGHYDFDVVWRN